MPFDPKPDSYSKRNWRIGQFNEEQRGEYRQLNNNAEAAMVLATVGGFVAGSLDTPVKAAFVLAVTAGWQQDASARPV